MKMQDLITLPLREGRRANKLAMRGGVIIFTTTQALILLKILLTPPRICQQILPSLKGRVI
jgi:hypothetical protein